MMVVDSADIGTQSVLIDGTEIERVNKFKYLGSLVSVDSNNASKIITRRSFGLTILNFWYRHYVTTFKSTRYRATQCYYTSLFTNMVAHKKKIQTYKQKAV